MLGRILKRRWIEVGLALLVIGSSLFLYKDYFKWKTHYYYITDQYKFSGESWQKLITASIFDYLPIWAPMPPASAPKGDSQIILGQGTSSTLFKNSVLQKYAVDTKTPSTFMINTFYFPGWMYFVDGREVKVDPKRDKNLGLPEIELLPGNHIVTAEFKDTEVRSIGNWLTIFSIAGLLGFFIIAIIKSRHIKL